MVWAGLRLVARMGRPLGGRGRPDIIEHMFDLLELAVAVVGAALVSAYLGEGGTGCEVPRVQEARRIQVAAQRQGVDGRWFDEGDVRAPASPAYAACDTAGSAWPCCRMGSVEPLGTTGYGGLR